jgi:prepilin-type N-terminal cleavage/methylation domain-containing protein
VNHKKTIHKHASLKSYSHARHSYADSRNENGFTLIELLVVTSIMGMLASITMVAVNEARMRARDTLRVVNAREVIKALALYQADYGYFPSCHTVNGNPVPTLLSIHPDWETCLGRELQPYLPIMPKDPINSLAKQSYYNYVDGDANGDGIQDNFSFYYFTEIMPGPTDSNINMLWYNGRSIVLYNR